MTDLERRFTKQAVELRAAQDDKRTIGGYAAVFGRQSKNLGGFVERLDPTVFNASRGDGWPDVMARYNHDDLRLLGTTAAGTLRLMLDGTGLDYEADVPATREDVMELVRRGDVTKSSFAFRTIEDDWDLNEQGFPMRTLLKAQLVDVAPVNLPAYADATAGLRSLAVAKEAEYEEVRALAESGELRKFFVRTDQPAAKPEPETVPDNPGMSGVAARAALLALRYVD